MITDRTQKRLGDIARFVSGGTPSKQAESYWHGDTPWVSAKDLKSFYINSSIDTLSELGRDAASIIPRGAILILVRGMTLFKSIPICIASRDLAINQDIKGIVAHSNVIPEYLAYSLLAKESELLAMVEAAGHGTGRLDTDALKDLRIQLPETEEQKTIANTIATWDTAIQKTEKLIVAKSKKLSCSREHLLGNSDFIDRIHLGDVSTELTARNGKLYGREAIMAVTKQSGLRPMREETIAANIERYKRVPPHAFAYNPMRLNIGSIAMSRFDHEVLVSPDYVVFACDQSQLIPAYLDHLRHSNAWRNHFELAGNGSVRVRIYYNDLRSFRFQLPSIEAQTRIVRLLDAASDEINLLKQQVTALQTQKRGLMQKLLTGQWRLPPLEGEHPHA